MVIPLITLLLSALVVAGVPVLHAHDAAEPALYDEECPLAGLAAHPVAAPVPVSPSDIAALAAVETQDLPAVSFPRSTALSPQGPRAPPTY